MAHLYLKADIYPDLGKLEQAQTAYTELVIASLREQGCLLYDLVVSEESPNVWHMFEKWESKAAWDDHMETEHVARIQQLEPQLIVAPTKLNFYTPLAMQQI